MTASQFIRELYNILFCTKLGGMSVEDANLRNLQVSKSICKSLARGNISLISGKYLTTQQLEDRRRKNLSYQFFK